jgi:hypothetical protein
MAGAVKYNRLTYSSGSLFAPFFRTCSLTVLPAALLAALAARPATCADILEGIGGRGYDFGEIRCVAIGKVGRYARFGTCSGVTVT